MSSLAFPSMLILFPSCLKRVQFFLLYAGDTKIFYKIGSRIDCFISRRTRLIKFSGLQARSFSYREISAALSLSLDPETL